MKKIVLAAFVLLCAASVSFGGELEDCLNECKARNGGVLANKCLNENCGHLNHNSEVYGNSYTGGLVGYTGQGVEKETGATGTDSSVKHYSTSE